MRLRSPRPFPMASDQGDIRRRIPCGESFAAKVEPENSTRAIGTVAWPDPLHLLAVALDRCDPRRQAVG